MIEDSINERNQTSRTSMGRDLIPAAPLYKRLGYLQNEKQHPLSHTLLRKPKYGLGNRLGNRPEISSNFGVTGY